MIRALALVFVSVVLFAAKAQSQLSLSDDEVRILVLNTPDVIQVEARGGCPTVELIPGGRQQVAAQVRNSCPTSGTGLIDNLTIDRSTGVIWRGMDTPTYIDSERLRLLRRVLMRKEQ